MFKIDKGKNFMNFRLLIIYRIIIILLASCSFFAVYVFRVHIVTGTDPIAYISSGMRLVEDGSFSYYDPFALSMVKTIFLERKALPKEK